MGLMEVRRMERGDKRRKVLEEILLNKRREVVQQIENLMEGQENTPVGNVILDTGDQSVKNHETDVDLTLLEMNNRLFKEIEEAIRKLKENRYGICEECGAEISAGRLKAVPFAKYCVACKEQQELFERIEKNRSEA
jgi:DnaK suppressor protein